MMSALLHVKDLKVSYGGINAVKGIDLHVNQGELVALIGANGAGKSSSMKAIAGLLTPSAGEIHFTNQETRKLPAYELVRLGLGMVPEGRGVFKRMTILENLQMGAYLKTNPKDIERKLEEVYSYLHVVVLFFTVVALFVCMNTQPEGLISWIWKYRSNGGILLS